MAIRQETNTPAASVHQSVQMRTDDCLVEWLQSFKSVSSRVRHILKTITIRNTTQNSKRICSDNLQTPAYPDILHMEAAVFMTRKQG